MGKSPPEARLSQLGQPAPDPQRITATTCRDAADATPLGHYARTVLSWWNRCPDAGNTQEESSTLYSEDSGEGDGCGVSHLDILDKAPYTCVRAA